MITKEYKPCEDFRDCKCCYSNAEAAIDVLLAQWWDEGREWGTKIVYEYRSGKIRCWLEHLFVPQGDFQEFAKSNRVNPRHLNDLLEKAVVDIKIPSDPRTCYIVPIPRDQTFNLAKAKQEQMWRQ